MLAREFRYGALEFPMTNGLPSLDWYDVFSSTIIMMCAAGLLVEARAVLIAVPADDVPDVTAARDAWVD